MMEMRVRSLLVHLGFTGFRFRESWDIHQSSSLINILNAFQPSFVATGNKRPINRLSCRRRSISLVLVHHPRQLRVSLSVLVWLTAPSQTVEVPADEPGLLLKAIKLRTRS